MTGGSTGQRERMSVCEGISADRPTPQSRERERRGARAGADRPGPSVRG
jgi:hypothetical protein